jgi:translation elongation factor P/translation initiation factor 5A
MHIQAKKLRSGDIIRYLGSERTVRDVKKYRTGKRRWINVRLKGFGALEPTTFAVPADAFVPWVDQALFDEGE